MDPEVFSAIEESVSFYTGNDFAMPRCRGIIRPEYVEPLG